MNRVIVDDAGRMLWTLGQKIKGTEHSIGDIVLWKVPNSFETGFGMIIANNRNGTQIMGRRGFEPERGYQITDTVVPASLLTNELLQYFSYGSYHIKEEDKMNEHLTITIPLEEYERLLYDSEKLGCLELCGVDNWSGYGDAMEMMNEDYENFF